MEQTLKKMSLKGFTLVELIIILILVGILAVYVAPKITTKEFKEEAEVTRFRTHIRFIQHKSMIAGGLYGIEVSSNGYKMLDNSTIVRFPDESNDEVKVSGGISINNSQLTDNKIYFDYLGRPVDSNQNILTTTTTIMINSKSVKLDPYAGGIY